MEYSIRKFDFDDLKNPGFFETLSVFNEFKISQEAAEKIFEEYKTMGIKTYVALFNGDIVGVIKLIFEPKYYHEGKAVAHIEDVAVHPSHRHKGIASLLISHALKIISQHECYKVNLSCQEGLIPFYNGFGFRAKGVNMRLDL